MDFKKLHGVGHRYLTPVIPSTHVAEIRRIEVSKSDLGK
jgi:hypothetical protein